MGTFLPPTVVLWVYFSCYIRQHTSLFPLLHSAEPTMGQRWLSGKEFSCQHSPGDARFNPRVKKIPWRRKWQPSPVFLPGESHGWRNLVGYSPQGRKESDMTEQLHFTSFSPFCSCRQSFPASGSFKMSQLFASCGQRIGVSASALVLPMNT